MAPEEDAETQTLLLSFERRFLAARALRSFPWQGLEEKLKGPAGSEVLLGILQKDLKCIRARGQSHTPSFILWPGSAPGLALGKTVRHPVCVKHPPSVKYRRSFLSELIRRHEATQSEPLDKLYEALAGVLTAQEGPSHHRTYLLPSGDAVTLMENSAIVSQGTTGLVTWTAALYLAEWALQNPDTFTHRTVLELGSGAGLTGLAICKGCQPSAFIFSDSHHRVLQQLRANVLLNGLVPETDLASPGPHDTKQPRVAVAQLDWDVVTGPQLAAFQPDIVLAADVLYCPETTHSLARALQRLAECWGHQEAPVAYVAFTARNPETCQLFVKELGLAGIPWEKMPQHSRSLFPYEEEQVETAILKLTLRVPSNAVDTPGNHQAQDGISLETHRKPQTFK